MRTVPATIDRYRARDGATDGAIIKLTDGVSTWYFGTHSIPEFTEGHVYPILESKFATSEGIDIFTKQWHVSALVINLMNGPYKKDASFEWVKLCDEIGSLIDTTADLYLFSGPEVDAVADCIHRFSGKIIKHPTYDTDRITIEIVDKWNAVDVIIPQTLMSSVYSDCPDEVRNKYIPLVYGDFTFDITSPYAGDGMAKGYPTVKGEKPTFVFSDHVLNAITDLWAPRLSSFPLEYTGHTLNADNGGYGTGVGTGTYLWLWMWPNGTDDQGHGFPANKPTNYGRMHDKSFSSYAIVKDNVADSCPAPAFIIGIGWVSFDEDQENSLMGILSANDTNSHDTPMEVTYKTDSVAAAEPGVGVVEIHFQAGAELANAMTADGTTRTSSFTFTSANLAAKDKRINLAVEWSVACADASGTIGDDIVNNADLMWAYELYLKVAYYFPAGLGSYTAMDREGSIVNERVGWAICKGREYGSWITDDGRSIGSYSPGDYIKEIAHIVESLLRDEMGLADADIDMDSFDDVVGSDQTDGVLNQLKRESCLKVIRRLSEQSTFVFFIDGVSLARTIRLNDDSPSTSTTILATHIMPKKKAGPPNIKVTKTAIYCDKMIRKYGWQGEYDDYRFVSTTGAGDIVGEFEWPDIAWADASSIASHLISGDAIWGEAHVQIDFNTKGLVYAEIEVGDWIEIDDTTMDPHQLCYGASWSGKQFLVVGIKQQLSSTAIKALQLY